MTTKRLTTGILGQLIEIDNARAKKGQPGIHDEVAELVNRLTSGGVGVKSSDQRIAQAKRLWDKGWGQELKIDSFEAYFATIPEIPAKPPIDDLDELVLVDRRIPLTVACRLAGLAFEGHDLAVPFASEETKMDVEWMWCQFGYHNRGRAACTCREECREGEIVCDAFEGVAIYTQDPKVIRGHNMDLPGSSFRAVNNHIIVANLGYWDDGPELKYRFDISDHPYFGSASRWAGEDVQK